MGNEPRHVIPEKPQSAQGYPASASDLCERTLVTLLRGLGPWKESIVLVGGLAPRYRIDQRQLEPDQPPHVGTLDIDLVLSLEVIAETEAYASIEKNLKNLAFERTPNEAGQPRHFQWSKRVSETERIVVDLLQDAAPATGGRPVDIQGERRRSALGIPGAGLALENFIEVPITANLLDNRGIAIETIRVCGIVPFLVLKLLAYNDRFEHKDAYDVVYCVMNSADGPRDVGVACAKSWMEQPGNPYLEKAISILKSRFASEPTLDGSLKDGPVSYAQFLSLPQEEPTAVRLRQQDASAVIESMLVAFEEERLRLSGE